MRLYRSYIHKDYSVFSVEVMGVVSCLVLVTFLSRYLEISSEIPSLKLRHQFVHPFIVMVRILVIGCEEVLVLVQALTLPRLQDGVHLRDVARVPRHVRPGLPRSLRQLLSRTGVVAYGYGPRQTTERCPASHPG